MGKNRDYVQLPVRERTKNRLKSVMKKIHTYDSFLNVLLDLYRMFDDRILREWFENNYHYWYVKVEKVREGEYVAYRADGSRETVHVSVLSSDAPEVDKIFCLVDDVKNGDRVVVLEPDKLLGIKKLDVKKPEIY